jgi:tetratricopeptide (TPR) repeat protein
LNEGTVKRSSLFKAEIIALVFVAVLWAVNLKTNCVPRATAGALRQVVKVAPNSQSAYTMLGRAYHKMNRRAEAAQAFGQAQRISTRRQVEANPNDARAHLALGRDYHYTKERNLQLAIEEYRTAVRLDPNFAGAWLFLGLAYEQEGRYEEAMGAFQEAVHLTPTPPACGCLANMCMKVIKTNPENMDAHLGLGLAHYQLRELEPAITAYEEAVTRVPKCRDAYEWLASCYWESGRPEKSIETWKRAAEVDPDWTWPHIRLAFDYNDLARYSESIAAWKTVISHQPNVSGSYVGLGDVHANAGDHDSAIRAYQKSLSLDPENERAHFCLGKAYIETGKKPLASKEYDVLRELDEELAGELLALMSKEASHSEETR